MQILKSQRMLLTRLLRPVNMQLGVTKQSGIYYRYGLTRTLCSFNLQLGVTKQSGVHYRYGLTPVLTLENASRSFECLFQINC